MRWISKERKIKSKEGSTRVKRKFLFFPKKINGEVRWLEKVRYKQEFVSQIKSGRWFVKRTVYKWINSKWIDDDKFDQ